MAQPKSIVCQPGDKLRFSVETSKTAKAYQWYWNEKEICKEDKDYDGSTTEALSIDKCLPKHKGSYKCVLVTELDTSLSTEIATLQIGMHTELYQAPFKSSSLLFCPSLNRSRHKCANAKCAH